MSVPRPTRHSADKGAPGRVEFYINGKLAGQGNIIYP
jgi:hypothetical protein